MKTLPKYIVLILIGYGCHQGPTIPEYETDADLWLEINDSDVYRINEVKFSASGNMLAASYESKVQFWTVPGWNKKFMLGFQSNVLSIDFSPDSKYFAVGCENNIVYIYDLATNALYKELTLHDGSVNDVKFSPDEKILATAGGKDIILWSLSTWETIKILTGPSLKIRNLAFRNDGKKLASHYLSNGEELLVWDLDNFEFSQYYIDKNIIWNYSMRFAPDTDYLCCATGMQLDFWDTNTQEQVALNQPHIPSMYIDYGLGGTLLVSGYEYTAQGKPKGRVDFLLKQSGIYNITNNFETSNFYFVDVSPSHVFVATCGYSNKIDIYKVDNIINSVP